MKIKTWLLLTYLVVMIIPLVTAYVLFAWVNGFNKEREVTNYLQMTVELQEIKEVLDNPSLYESKVSMESVEALENEERLIVLYNHEGLTLYSSHPEYSPYYFRQRAELLKGSYTLEQTFNNYEYRQPVFKDSSLVGFFYVKLARGEWVKGVSERGSFMLGIFIITFILVYLSAVKFVDRKLNVRIKRLMTEMTAFSQGETMQESPVNNDEIGQLKQHFYQMKRQMNEDQLTIKQAQEAKEYMVATISHDLKTPLTSIKAYTETIINEPTLTREEQIEYHQIVLEKADYMKAMLDDLLTYSILQSSSYTMDLVEVDGSEFFEMLLSDYKALCKQKEIQLTRMVRVTGTYLVNPKQMMRVADNLFMNAIQHTPDGGKVWLIASSDADWMNEELFEFIHEEYSFHVEKYVYLIVQNEGPGIAACKLVNVLDLLYQVDEARSKRENDGSGLGLSITDQIITRHDGEVEVFSRENIGTAVICRLPKIGR